MKKEELKGKCDITKVEERIFTDLLGEEFKADYIIDSVGNAILPVPPLQFKIIEKILDLEVRIKVLEDAKEG